MTPTKEKLADPKWWEKHAPEGATHAAFRNQEEINWYREIELSSYMVWNTSGKNWVRCPGSPVYGPVIDRPTQPQWIEGGLPPVGIECEFYNGKSEAWEHCTVVAHHDFGAVAAVHEDNLEYSYHWGAGSDFRLIRTQADMEREEVVEKALEHSLFDCTNGEANMLAGFARNLYDAGMLRKPIDGGKLWRFMVNEGIPVRHRKPILDWLGLTTSIED